MENGNILNVYDTIDLYLARICTVGGNENE